MSNPVRIVGSFLSPYVRKVLVTMQRKGIAFCVDPIVPFFGDDRFSAASPLRRVPVYIDDRVTLCDSTVICQYLEDICPEPSMYPRDVADRARARWIEEYADTRMGDVFIWHLFNQVAIGPAVWGRPTDDAVVKRAVDEEIPVILDWIETLAPALGFLFGDTLSIADVSLAVFLRNAEFARYRIDEARWPRAAGLISRVLATEGFTALRPFEDLSIRTPIARHRQALGSIGAPLTADTWYTDKPRPGIMTATP